MRDELSYCPEKLEEAEERVRQEDASVQATAQPAEQEQAPPEVAQEQPAEYWVQCESCKK